MRKRLTRALLLLALLLHTGWRDVLRSHSPCATACLDGAVVRMEGVTTAWHAEFRDDRCCDCRIMPGWRMHGRAVVGEVSP